MIGVEDQDAIKRTYQHRIHLVLFRRHGKHHAHEVLAVRQVIARVNKGLANRILVGHGYDGRNLGNQAERRNLAVLRVIDVQRVMVEGRQGPHHADHDGHWMRIAAEPGEKAR